MPPLYATEPYHRIRLIIYSAGRGRSMDTLADVIFEHQTEGRMDKCNGQIGS